MKLKAAELAGEQVDNKTRLDIIKHEEDIIAAETKARQEEEAAELEEKARVSAVFLISPPPPQPSPNPVPVSFYLVVLFSLHQPFVVFFSQ